MVKKSQNQRHGRARGGRKTQDTHLKVSGPKRRTRFSEGRSKGNATPNNINVASLQSSKIKYINLEWIEHSIEETRKDRIIVKPHEVERKQKRRKMATEPNQCRQQKT